MKPIPYGKQEITQDDINAVIEVLQSDFLTQGPNILEFEKSFSEFIGCKYSVAVSNGTAALHLSMLALNVNPGDKVITTPISFSATSNCVRYCGGEVVFCDIDSKTQLLDLIKLREILSQKPKGTYKGIIPVDFAGYPLYMKEFREIADEYDLWIVEDACHAFGGYYFDSSIKHFCGDSNFSDISVFSFHPVKHIATGEGGMITTNNYEIYKKLLLLRTHGITKESNCFQNRIEVAFGTSKSTNNFSTEYPGWYYEMQVLGFNYRLTDIQAALGISQLRRADKGLEIRRKIAQKYYDALSNQTFVKHLNPIKEGHAYHLFIIEIEARNELYEHLKSANIFTQIHYIPIHLMPYYRALGWNEGDFPNAESYYKNCISLPMFPSLSNLEQEYVIDKILTFYNNFSKNN